MENRVNIKIPNELQEYMWFRYMPISTYKTYLMVGAVQAENLKGLEATQRILNTNLQGGKERPQVTEDKKKLLTKLGLKYPENRQDDLDLLLKYNLIKLKNDNEGNIIYVYTNPVPKPEDVLNLDEEEKQILENIKFEIKHQNEFNKILSLILNNGQSFSTTMDNISNATKVKHSDIKNILYYLVQEGSIKIIGKKDIKKLRKNDKIYISIDKKVFKQKRFILD